MATRVNSKAAVGRIQAGTKLRCVHNSKGACDSPRTVLRASRRMLVMTIDDSREYTVTRLRMEPRDTVEATADGFVLRHPAGPNNVAALVEYVFYCRNGRKV